MRKSGFHVQKTSNELREAILAVRPTMCVSLAHDRDFWLEILQLFPEVLLIDRLYESGRDWRQQSPEEWAELCAAQNMPYHAWITWNEPHGVDNQVTAEDAALYDDFCMRFRTRALELGFEAVGPNIAAGNWHGDAIVRHMPRWCMQAKYISRHEYSARAMWDQAPALERQPWEVPLDDGEHRGWWYTLTYRAWYNAIVTAYPYRRGQFEVPITEGGVAYGVIPDAEGRPKYGDVGWRTDMGEEDYVNSLKWYTGELNKDAYCTGWAIFMTGADDPFWDSFETLPLANRLLEIPEVPELPPEEDMNNIKVIDMNYQERDFKYAEDKYGVAFRRAEVAEGQLVYRLVELWEATGHHSLITQVLDEDGKAMENAAVTFYWSGAPQPPSPPTEVYPHDWFKRYVWGRTNVNGDVGPGMGGGAWIDVDPEPPHNAIGGGPHAVWVHDPNIPSDICEKLGMRGGTNHDHLDQKFQLMIVGEGNGNGDGDVVLKYAEKIEQVHNVSALAIAYPTEVSVDTRGDGRGPGVDEDLHPQEWIHPVSGVRMAMVELTTDFDGIEARTYTLRVYRMSDMASLTNTESEVFQPLGSPRKRVVYVYVKDEAPDEPPEPEPPGDLVAAVVKIEGHLAAIRGKYVGDVEGPEPPLEPPPPEPEVFDVEFFNNMNLDEPPVHIMKEKPPFAHNWGLGSPVPGVVNEDYISGRWSGIFTFEAGTHRFAVKTDDGAKVFVDDELIISEWYPQSPQDHFADVALAAGKHSVRVEWFEQSGGATLHVAWTRLSQLAVLLRDVASFFRES